MSGTQGSAREEAERLVAAVLAMASQVTKDARTGRSGGLGAVGDALAGMVSQVVAATGGLHGTGAEPGGAAGPEAGAPARPEAAGAVSGGAGWSTGSAECCVCPICRIIAGLRDPGAETAERLATGAGDFAAGVASLLRSLSDAGSAGGRRSDPDAAADDAAWRAATHAGPGAAGPDVAGPGAAGPAGDRRDAGGAGDTAP